MKAVLPKFLTQTEELEYYKRELELAQKQLKGFFAVINSNVNLRNSFYKQVSNLKNKTGIK